MAGVRGEEQALGFGEEGPICESRVGQSGWHYFNLEPKCRSKTQPNPSPSQLSSPLRRLL